MTDKGIFDVKNLNMYYGKNHALKNINIDIGARSITAIIGPSGCGKSTFLKCLDRMNDLVPGTRVEGAVNFKGKNIYDKDVDVVELRKNVGMVFQKPNPFPMSVYDNVAYGPRIHGIKDKRKLDSVVETSLKQSALWEELKDRSATRPWACRAASSKGCV